MRNHDPQKQVALRFVKMTGGCGDRSSFLGEEKISECMKWLRKRHPNTYFVSLISLVV